MASGEWRYRTSVFSRLAIRISPLALSAHASQRGVVARHSSGSRRNDERPNRTKRLDASHTATPHSIRTNEPARRIDQQLGNIRIELPVVRVTEQVLLDVGDVERPHCGIVL